MVSEDNFKKKLETYYELKSNIQIITPASAKTHHYLFVASKTHHYQQLLFLRNAVIH